MKISHKGLLLVSVPLIFQIGFAIALINVLQQADKEIQKQTEAQDLIAAVDSCQRHWTRGLCSTLLFIKTDRDQFRQDQRKAEKQVLVDLDRLNALPTAPLGNGQNDYLPRARDLLTRSMQLERFMMTPIGKQIARQRIDSAGESRYAAWPLESVILKLKFSEKDAAKQRQVAAERIDLTLKAGILFSFIGTIGLALYFNQDIVKRLGNVLVNVERLRNNRAPAKALPGTDEIADLDRVLFGSANEILALEKFREETTALIGKQLKVPLCSIENIFGELRENHLSTSVSEILEIGHRNSQRLVRLINDLLDSAHQTTDGLDLKKERVTSLDLANTSFDAVQEFADRHAVKLEYRSGIDTIYGDSERLIQALINLLSNAIKFSPKGGTVILSVNPGNGCHELAVSDCGRGIPPEQIAKIFDRFGQVDRTDRTAKGGSGLGLPITKSIVEKHGGIIEVDSIPDKGSVFRIKLPIEGGSSLAPIKPDAANDAPKRFQLKLSHKGFLLISIPLISTIILAAAIMNLSRTAEQEVETRFANKEILATLGTVSTKALDTVLISMAQLARHSDIRAARLEDDRRDAQALLSRFGQLTAADPAQKPHYEQLKELLAAVQEFQQKILEGKLDLELEREKDSPTRQRHRLEDLDKLIEEETAILNPNQQTSQRKIQTYIYSTLLILLFSNIMLALVSVLIFSRSIIKRTDHIATNVKLLVDRRELDPPVKGSDELALIDIALTEAAKHLSELRQYKKQLIGIISHELKTPLTAIKGSLELLLAGVYGELPASLRDRLRLADKQAASLISLIRDLLDIERIESGNLELRTRSEDLDDVLEEALSAVSDEAAEKSVTIIPEPANTNVYCDKDHLCQALTKVLLAAISFSPPHEKIVLSINKIGPLIAIKIRHQGTAFSSAQRDQLFTKFSGLPDDQNNYSLGLYLAKKTIEAQNGSLILELDNEDGNCFVLTVSTTKEESILETSIKSKNAG